MIWMVGIMMVTLPLSFFQETLFASALLNLSERLRSRYFSALMRQEIDFFETRSAGELVNRLAQDTAAVQSVLSQHPPQLAVAASKFTGSIALIFINSWIMGVVSVAGLPVVGIAMYFAGKTIRKDQVA